MGKVSKAASASEKANAGELLALPSSCTVRESAALKAELLTVFDSQSTVTLDMRAVERVDTSVLQLLLSFVRDRLQQGRVTKWMGLPDCVNEAVGVLGLSSLLGIAVSDPNAKVS
jgi:anti-anti-sigma regulatory factor